MMEEEEEEEEEDDDDDEDEDWEEKHCGGPSASGKRKVCPLKRNTGTVTWKTK